MRGLAAWTCVACLAAGGAGAALAGCTRPVRFPEAGAPLPAGAGGGVAYDTDGDGKADFFAYYGAAGRIERIGYDTTGDGQADVVVDLDFLTPDRCRHLILVLDGFGYDLVKDFRDAGGLRMFHPPSRVIAPYPTLTDPCLEDALGYMPCRGMEALYYYRRLGRLVGGSLAYLRGDNAPYNRLLHYRADMVLDAVGYLWPWPVFGKEVNDAKREFDKARTQEMRAYFVSSAGVGTRQGAEGQRMCLRRVEQLINQVICETRGLTKVTLLSDHGHSYTPAGRISLEAHLRSKGWRLTDRLEGPRDVVYVRFGLETYACFGTRSKAALASDLVTCQGGELASHADGQAVVVLGAGGASARISQKAGRYRYEAASGDPLKMKPILANLAADAEGFCDADEMLRATATHVYPAALERLWRAHFGLVESPPDVILSLDDAYYSGSTAFGGAVTVESTHGGLSYRNSAAFIMSTAGRLPDVMRSADIPRHMRNLVGTWVEDRTSR